MKYVKNIFRNSKMKNLSFGFICLVFFISCNNDYLKEAIESDAIICPLIHAGNSEIILIRTYSEDLITELNENFNIKNAENFITKCMKEGLSIRVSASFYEEHSQYRIKADSLIDKIYREDGIRGLFDKYTKKGGYGDGIDILWNEEEMFPVGGKNPYPSFGKDTNKGYLVYLFSKHNIFFLWGSMEDIYMIYLCPSISDMSALE